MTTGERLLTLNETAAYLRVSRDTVARWVSSGKLRGSKIGAQWRFESEDVRRFLEERKTGKPAK